MGEQRKDKGKEDGPPRDGRIVIQTPDGGKHAEILAEVTRAYGRGDMYMARKQALAVVADDPSDEEREFAEIVIKRTDHDPLALVLGLGTLVMFFVIMAIYL